MISLSAPSFALNGALVVLNGAARPKPLRRRAQRVATLDGGAILVDGGYSAADLTFVLTLPDRTGASHAFIAGLIANYPSVVVCCADGCYLALLDNLSYKNGQTTLNALVLEDLTA